MNDTGFISFGNNITAHGDRLGKVDLRRFYDSLRSPKPDIATRIRQLRIIYSVDVKRYRDLKRSLPYVVCALFNPPFRRTENFASTQYFIVDIDHVDQKGLDMQLLRQRIETDPQVLLTFLSPSLDGLKVMFRLKHPCADSGVYSLFYKLFVEQFCAQYQLEQVADRSTSDVCRACFVSVDPDAYLNPDAEPVCLESYVDIDNPQLAFDQKQQLEQREKKNGENLAKKTTEEKDPGKDVILKIRETLNLKPRLTDKVPPYVPQQLNDIIGDMTQYITQAGIIVKEVINIQYGKKLRLTLGFNEAEINVFYGKRGYSVVQSPRSGTNPDLNQLCADIINSFLAEKEIL